MTRITRLLLSTMMILTLGSISYGEEVTKSFFDLTLTPERTVNSKTIQDFIPPSVFQVKKSMSFSEVGKTLNDFETSHAKGIPPSKNWLMGKTPKSAYLENLDVHWEGGRILALKLHANRLPPSKGQLERWVTELQRILGKPHMAFHMVSYGRENPRTLVLEWKNDPETFRLSMEGSSKTMSLEFNYYPGPNNPALPRINRRPPKPIPFESLEELLRKFIDKIDLLPAGDGPHPALVVPKGEGAMLEAYFTASFASNNDNRDSELYFKPFKKQLSKNLKDHYSNKEKPALFEHLLKICQGKARGLSSGGIQVGAAYFLASYEDPEAIDFLFRGMKVELPTGVRTACAEGIARQCTGKLMDQVLGMLLNPDQNSDAVRVLRAINSQEQLDELRLKIPNQDPSLQEQLSAIISLISRRIPGK